MLAARDSAVTVPGMGAAGGKRPSQDVLLFMLELHFLLSALLPVLLAQICYRGRLIKAFVCTPSTFFKDVLRNSFYLATLYHVRNSCSSRDPTGITAVVSVY